MVNLSKKTAAAAGGGRLIDISPTSQYFVSKEAGISYYPQSNTAASHYQLYKNAMGGHVWYSKKLKIDLSDVTKGMTAPTLIFPFGVYTAYMDADGKYVKIRLIVEDKDGFYFCSSGYNTRGALGGYINYFGLYPTLHVNWTSKKDEEMTLVFYIEINDLVGGSCTGSLFVPAYVQVSELES